MRLGWDVYSGAISRRTLDWRMAVRALAIGEGRMDRLSMDELDVRRLRVQELITDRQLPQSQRAAGASNW